MYFLRKVLLAAITAIGISVVAFAAGQLIPGDPAVEHFLRFHDRPPTPQEIQATREELGLVGPIGLQYARWVRSVGRGEFGISYGKGEAVTVVLRRRVPATLQLAVPAAGLAVVLAVPLGLLSAKYRGMAVDKMLRVLSLVGASIPGFWLALLLITYFAVNWSLVPVAGRHGWSSAILPIVALTVSPMATLARFTRSAALEVLSRPHVTAARARGVPQLRLMRRHVLRNSLIPIVTAFGLSFGHLLAGAVIIETIFAWPGLGSLAYDAIAQRDYPMIQAFVLYAGLLFVGINLTIDGSYALIDPSIRG